MSLTPKAVGIAEIYGTIKQNDSVDLQNLEKLKAISIHQKYDDEEEDFRPMFTLHWLKKNRKFQGNCTTQSCPYDLEKKGRKYFNFNLQIDRTSELVRVENQTFYDFKLADLTKNKKAWIENGMKDCDNQDQFSSDSEFSEDEEIKNFSRVKSLQAQQNLKFEKYNLFCNKQGPFLKRNLLETFLITIDNKYKLSISDQNGIICKFHFTKLKMNFDLKQNIVNFEVDNYRLKSCEITNLWNFSGNRELQSEKLSIQEMEEAAIKNDQDSQVENQSSTAKAKIKEEKSSSEVIPLVPLLVDLIGTNQTDLSNDVEHIDKNDSELIQTIIMSHCQEDEANGFQYLDANTLYFTYRDVSRNKTIFLVEDSNVTPVTTASSMSKATAAGSDDFLKPKKREWLEMSSRDDEDNNNNETCISEGQSCEKYLRRSQSGLENMRLTAKDEKETLPFTNFMPKTSSDFTDLKAGKWRYFSGTKDKFFDELKFMISEIEGKTGCDSFLRIYSLLKKTEMNSDNIRDPEFLYRDEWRLFDEKIEDTMTSSDFTITCPICFDEETFHSHSDPKIKDNFVKIHSNIHVNGQHPYVCIECFERFLRSKIHNPEDGNELTPEDFKCPADMENNCNELIHYETILKFIEKGDFSEIVNGMDLVRGETREEKLKKFRKEKANQFITNLMMNFLFKCPGVKNIKSMAESKKEDETDSSPTCSRFFRNDPTTVSSKMIEQSAETVPVGIYCDHCSHDHCIKCKESYHAPATCQLIKNWNLEHDLHCKDVVNAANELASEKYVQMMSRTCPNIKCGANIQKTQGCNNMTCRQCKTQFCFLCGVKFQKPYEHPQPGCVKGQGRDWVWANRVENAGETELNKQFDEHLKTDSKLTDLKKKKDRYEKFKKTIDGMQKKIQHNSKMIGQLKTIAINPENLAYLKSKMKLKSEYEKTWVEACLMLKRARNVWVYTHICIYFYALQVNNNSKEHSAEVDNIRQSIDFSIESIENMTNELESRLKHITGIHQEFDDKQKTSSSSSSSFCYPVSEIYEEHCNNKQRFIDLTQQLEERCRAIVGLVLELEKEFGR